jgi:hypothetical protein
MKMKIWCRVKLRKMNKKMLMKKKCWLTFSLGFKVYVFNVWEYAWSSIKNLQNKQQRIKN